MNMQMDWDVTMDRLAGYRHRFLPASPRPGYARPASPVPALLRGMLCSLVVLSLPPGAGVALIALVSTSCWRLTAAARK